MHMPMPIVAMHAFTAHADDCYENVIGCLPTFLVHAVRLFIESRVLANQNVAIIVRVHCGCFRGNIVYRHIYYNHGIRCNLKHFIM